MLPLSGVSVLVTRPAGQTKRLAGEIERAGGRAILFPVIEIADVEDDAKLKSILERLGEYDLAIFVSPNAVEWAMKRMKALPPVLKFAAVGKATLAALEACGAHNVLIPEGRYDSEGLLELPELQSVRGMRIVIFRGVGGREHLGDELKSRGASVDYAECYRRLKPESRAVLHEDEVQAVIATSGEIVTNLCEVTRNAAWIRKKPMFVTHERIGKIAKDSGFGQVVVTDGGDEGLVLGLIKWFEFGEKTHGNG